ncbi:MAG: DNA repair protein RecN [Desulfitobacteriaceae bacterium]
MLVELHVQNFGLMEDILLSPGPGLTVFTGETGAGKSMLIDALSVLLGGRATADLVRHGEGQAKVEGVFTELPEPVLNKLEEAGYSAEEGQMFLYREVNASGRNVCRVQGRSVPLGLYRSLCEGLVDIHGQMDHQSLLRSETHRELLDALGGQEQLELKEEVSRAARAFQVILSKERELKLSDTERRNQVELLNYQLAEIDHVRPFPGEDETLNEERRRLSNAEKIISLSGEVYAALYQGSVRGPAAYDLLASSRKALSELVKLDGQCASMLEQLESIYYTLEDITEQVRAYRENFATEPGRLEQIEERLSQLHHLRKYGSSVQDILNKREAIHCELQDLGHLDEQLAEINRAKEKALGFYLELAGRLSQKRFAQAEGLEEGMARELSELGLEKSRVEVRLTPQAGPHPEGAEEVEFYFSANPGEPPKPLAKVASGGEMSRLMLALKSLLARVEKVTSFIFDEVDSGVGGRTVQRVGEKLSQIAREKQVFCITHAAPVAAYADEHYGIAKEIIGERTTTRVERLEPEARVEELARMLGGGGDISRRHARELWERGQARQV